MNIVGTHFVKFRTQTFYDPFDGLANALQKEIDEGRFPVVSLISPQLDGWQGYVVLQKARDNDFVVVTKKKSLQDPPCESNDDTLNNRIRDAKNNRPIEDWKVDCLFWTATRITPN